jgi:hypothetical protein
MKIIACPNGVFSKPESPTPISTVTIGKQGIFLGFYIFLGTEEYNSNIFIGTKAEEGTGHGHT